MLNLTARTDVVAAGSRLPLGQFQRAPRFMALLGVFLSELQLSETAIVESVPARYIQNATGWALEQIGLLVGCERPSSGAAATSDNAYRVLIYGQIAANISYGTEADLFNILRSLQLTNVKIFDVYPAAMTLNYTNNSLTLTCGCIRSILRRATPPIGLDITQHSEAAFGFEGDSDAFGFDDGELGEGL